jgi:hypothetical protein
MTVQRYRREGEAPAEPRGGVRVPIFKGRKSRGGRFDEDERAETTADEDGQ